MLIPNILKLGPNRVWRTYPGGKVLDCLEGKDTPSDTNFPEDWIGSTTRAINKGRENLIDEGLAKLALDGRSVFLKDLMEQYPTDMVGPMHYKKFGSHTQFLLKFLDSAIRLHIQCHPTVSFAKQYLNSNFGKTEAYYILQTRPEVKEPYIFMGFQHPPQTEAYKKAILEQDLAQITAPFEKIPIKPGDAFIVPGGLPHAIGEGVFMIEIMEPSDWAVRIEFEKGGYVLPEEARFLNRGVDFALSMFNFTQISRQDLKEKYFISPSHPHDYGGGIEYELVTFRHTPCFRVSRLIVSKTVERSDDSFYLAIVTRGHGHAQSGDCEVTLKQWDKIFVPYKASSVTFSAAEEMEIVITRPPI